MRKWVLSMVFLLGLVSSGWAEHFQVFRGSVMAVPEEGSISVNETTIALTPSTAIADKAGRTVDLGELKCGQWVSVELESDGESEMVAKKIILLQRETSGEERDRRLARVLTLLCLLTAHRHPR